MCRIARFCEGGGFFQILHFLRVNFCLLQIAVLLLYNWTIVHGGQKIESAQKIHTSRG